MVQEEAAFMMVVDKLINKSSIEFPKREAGNCKTTFIVHTKGRMWSHLSTPLSIRLKTGMDLNFQKVSINFTIQPAMEKVQINYKTLYE